MAHSKPSEAMTGIAYQLRGGWKPYAGDDFEVDRHPNKQGEELWAVDQVLSRLGFREYQLNAQDKPDVLVGFGSAKSPCLLGCEVMSLQSDIDHKGSALRRFRARWRRVMDVVLATLARDSNRVPYCVVDFQGYNESLDGADETLLVRELIGVGRMLKNEPTIKFPLAGTPTLNGRIREISLMDADGKGLVWWPRHLKSGPVSGPDRAVKLAVQTKRRQARKYDWKGVTERWLLLHAQAHGLCDMFGAAREIPLGRLPKRMPFTTILIWDRFSEDIWTVFPKYKVICDGSRQTRDLTALPASLRPFTIGNERYATRPKQR
jgi:hypothetical protein